MKLTILGSGCIYPDPQRGGPAFLVSHEDRHVLLDIGSSALRSLAGAGLKPTDLLGVCITHRHPDHTTELGLLLELGNTFGRRDPLLLAGPAILDDLATFHLGFGRARPSELDYPLQRLVLPGKGKLSPFAIEGRAVPHVEHSVGLRISAGSRTLAYPGDCGPGKEVIDLARDADLLILECTLPSGQQSAAHLSPDDAAEIALQAGCGRLILTHFKPDADVDQALAVCRKMGVDTEAAVDGAFYQV